MTERQDLRGFEQLALGQLERRGLALHRRREHRVPKRERRLDGVHVEELPLDARRRCRTCRERQPEHTEGAFAVGQR